MRNVIRAGIGTVQYVELSTSCNENMMYRQPIEMLDRRRVVRVRGMLNGKSILYFDDAGWVC